MDASPVSKPRGPRVGGEAAQGTRRDLARVEIIKAVGDAMWLGPLGRQILSDARANMRGGSCRKSARVIVCKNDSTISGIAAKH